MQRDFRDFLEKLYDACKSVPEEYFFFSTNGKNDTNYVIYRERVYCYELYHQLRMVLPRDFYYKLNGEVDKRGHELITKAVIPDFIVHVPGLMEKNLVVIEVKNINGLRNGIKKDIETLKSFVGDYRYQYGIFLVYGHERDKVLRIKESIDKEIKRYKGKIFLLWHPKPNHRPIELLDT